MSTTKVDITSMRRSIIMKDYNDRKFNLNRKDGLVWCSQCRMFVRVDTTKVVTYENGLMFRYCSLGHRVRERARSRDRDVGVKRI